VTPPSILPFSTLYWRVAGEDGGVVGPYAVGSFTKSLSSAPTTLTPTNGQVLTFPTNPVVFSWQPVSGAVSYTVQVANNASLISATQYQTYNTSLTLPDTQAFTLSDGTTLQSWYWQVQAVYPNSSVTQWSTAWNYQINWPATPVLESPANDAVGVIDTVFSWDPVPGAASYTIQVSPNGDWQNNKVIDQSGVLGTRYAPSTTLNNQSYYWRVRAQAAGSAVNYGQWSDPFVFNRSWSTRPVTISPHWTGGSADPPSVTNLKFDWTPAGSSGAGWVDHASHYEIQIGSDLNFSPGTYWTCTTDQTTFTPYTSVLGGSAPAGCGVPASLAIGTVYYWRVRGVDGPALISGLWDDTSSADTQRFIYLPNVPDESCGPTDGATVVTPVLCWAPFSGAEEYRVTIKNGLGVTVIDSVATYGTSYTPTIALSSSDGPFAWNVVSEDSQGHAGLIRGSWKHFNIGTPVTDTTFTLLSPASGASAVRMPSMTWQPYTGASYYQVFYGVTTDVWIATPLSGSGSFLPFAGFTYTLPLAQAHYYWEVVAYNSSYTAIATSPVGSFYVGTTPSYGDWIIPWNQYLTPECVAQTNPAVSLCTPLLGQTQEMTWTADPNAAAYLVYVAKDVNFTNVYREYETGQTSLTPEESWLDSQAGQSYYWFVRPCGKWDGSICGPGPDSNAGLNNASAYRKSSPAQIGLTTSTSANPPVTTTSPIPYQVTFNWADYMTTSQNVTYPVVATTDPVAPAANSSRVTQEAQTYHIQVSTTSDFGSIIDDKTVDQTQYTPWDRTYPEGPLYWRVQALDGSGNPLTLNKPQPSITKASPAITLSSPTSTATVTGLPYFTWQPQNWAARYTIEVYRNGDLAYSNSNLLSSATTPFPAWSPTATMPTGVYAWRVRRLDANGLAGPWSTGRTFTLQPAAPTLNTPSDLAKTSVSNMDFTWLSVQGAVSYQFQSSTTASFNSFTENQTTVMTAWSPTSQYSVGTFYWRVNLLDASSNVLSTSSVRSFDAGTPPGAPTGAVAVRANTGARVSWTAPTSAGSSAITGYTVKSSPGAKLCTTTGATTCNVWGLTNGVSYTFTVQAANAYGQGQVSASSNAVIPAGPHFVVSGMVSPRTAGSYGAITVTAKDANGNTNTKYTGTVHLTSSDAAATLPANYTFTSADAGVHKFGLTLKTAGTRSVTATDTATASNTGSQTGIVVTPGAATHFAVTGMVSPRTAGTYGTITVTAKDAYGNTNTKYTGTVHLTSTDGAAALPANYTFTASGAGVHKFGLTLKTAGTQSVTATDTVTASIHGSQTGIVVTAGAATHLAVTGMTSPRTAGSYGTVTVTAKDAYGNTAKSYTGTVHLTSTDGAAALPANYTFTVSDAGVHKFGVTLKTAGTRSVTATDTVTASIHGSQTGIVVS
jgi:FKBP-type peptidyl-prolyl cis-trans isomerase 2